MGVDFLIPSAFAGPISALRPARPDLHVKDELAIPHVDEE